jgi:2-polyprenyl-6-methoxyphenol hydroxylase-like FAD-dependent oxidoreductase
MTEVRHTDVVVVGASVAGCAAARLFATAGVETTLVERSPNPDAYKVACTHFIQASAMPTIRRLGFNGPLDAAGAVRGLAEVWTRAGWVRPRPGPGYAHERLGYSVRRETLDPILRRLARDTPGVELLAGINVTELIRDGDEVRGVAGRDPAGNRYEIRARLVVGADGAHSRVARLAGLRERARPHRRVYFMAYFRGAPLTSGDNAQLWLMDPDVAAAFPNEDGITVVAATPHEARLPEFKADLEGAYARFVAALPDGPPVHRGERISPIIGKIGIANLTRDPVAPGLALIGDAALASDPVAGVGIGWALQSAEWLVDATAEDLCGQRSVRAGLARYRRLRKARLGGHARMVSSYASGRPLNAFERLVLSGGVGDPKVALAIHSVAARNSSPALLAHPSVLGRALWSRRPAGQRVARSAAADAA